MQNERKHIAVVGAGAFGGWTALHLLRAGARVTLLDAWGPGNSRASSGGETRIIRGSYLDRIYVQLTARSLALWKENQTRWARRIFHQSGVMRFGAAGSAFPKVVPPLLREAGIAFEELTPAQAARQFPKINFEGVAWALHERDTGYLLARRGCAAVVEGFQRENGEYRQLAVEPGAVSGGAMRSLKLSDGSTLAADQFVFACGPWLGKVFPDVIGNRVKPSRQEVFFFGTPAGDPTFLDQRMPPWIDSSDRGFYGIPGNEWRGFKVADDRHGATFDPTSGDRTASPEAIHSAREYLAFRFPAMKGAPLVESRVCQYENSPDGHIILDRHPGAKNVWLLGGGSGHGYKLGAGLGEMAAQIVLEKRSPEPFFQLARLSAIPPVSR